MTQPQQETSTQESNNNSTEIEEFEQHQKEEITQNKTENNSKFYINQPIGKKEKEKLIAMS